MLSGFKQSVAITDSIHNNHEFLFRPVITVNVLPYLSYINTNKFVVFEEIVYNL